MKISPQQKVILEYLADGHMRKEIMDMMGLKGVSVDKYIRAAKDNLGALTKEHAVAIAIREGLIE